MDLPRPFKYMLMIAKDPSIPVDDPRNQDNQDTLTGNWYLPLMFRAWRLYSASLLAGRAQLVVCAPNKARQGYTLTELLITIAIVVIAAIVVVNALTRWGVWDWMRVAFGW